MLFTPTWEPCGAGTPECVRLTGGPHRFLDGIGAHDATRGFFVLRRLEPPDSGHGRLVLASTDGPALAAWRSRITTVAEGICEANVAGLSSDAAAVAVQAFGGVSPKWSRAYYGTHATIGRVDTPAIVLEAAELPGASGIQRLAVSVSTVVADVEPAGYLVVAEGGVARRLEHLPPVVASASSFEPQVAGRSVVWQEWSGDRVRLAHGTLDAPAALYYDAVTADTFEMRTDGYDVVWTQMYPAGALGSWTRLELWTSRYADRAADLVPRRLGDYPAGYATVGKVGEGLFAQFGPGQSVEIINLASGTSRFYWLPDPYRRTPGMVLWVTATELGLKVSDETTETVMRVDLRIAPLHDTGPP